MVPKKAFRTHTQHHTTINGKNNDNIHKWIIIYIFLVKLMVFYKFNIHTWINQHQKKTCGPLGQVIWSFYLAKTLVDISNQTQGLYYNIVHNVSTAIGSTTNKFAINGRRKPSTYGWFIFALLTLHILNVHVILLFPCRNVFFSARGLKVLKVQTRPNDGSGLVDDWVHATHFPTGEELGHKFNILGALVYTSPSLDTITITYLYFIAGLSKNIQCDYLICRFELKNWNRNGVC